MACSLGNWRNHSFHHNQIFSAPLYAYYCRKSPAALELSIPDDGERGIWNTRWTLKHSWHISVTTYSWLQTREVGNITSRGGSAAVLIWQPTSLLLCVCLWGFGSRSLVRSFLICYLYYGTYVAVFQRNFSRADTAINPLCGRLLTWFGDSICRNSRVIPYETMLVGRRPIQALARKILRHGLSKYST